MAVERRCGGISFIRRSLKRISPPSISTRPAMARSVVVLPHPDGPSSVRNSPSSTYRSRWSTTAFPSYTLSRPSSSRTAICSPDRAVGGERGDARVDSSDVFGTTREQQVEVVAHDGVDTERERHPHGSLIVGVPGPDPDLG